MSPSDSIVFIPVSGPTGVGEYYRCLAVAEHIARSAPERDIHFLISEQARVARNDQFHYHTLPGSPTKHSPQVRALLKTIKPAVAVFDSSIRTSQLRAAKQIGATVVAIVSRHRKRRKLLRPQKLRHLDSAWIVAPDAPPLSRLERLIINRWPGQLHFAGAILPPPLPLGNDTQQTKEPYILIAAGGGGGKQSDGSNTSDYFSQIAKLMAKQHHRSVVLIAGPQAQGALPQGKGLSALPSTPPGVLMQLIQNARVCILGGGSILLQALALAKATIAIPAGGKDQPQRIANLADNGVCLSATALCPPEVALLAEQLFNDDNARQALINNREPQRYEDCAEFLSNYLIDQASRKE